MSTIGWRPFVPRAPVQRRVRVLTQAELEAILPVLRASNRPQVAAMHFMLLTLARRDDVAETRWRDINFGQALWTIRDPKNTDGRPREPDIVPLSRQALALPQSRMPNPPRPDGLVFLHHFGRSAEQLGS
jgi:integrase